MTSGEDRPRRQQGRAKRWAGRAALLAFSLSFALEAASCAAVRLGALPFAVPTFWQKQGPAMWTATDQPYAWWHPANGRFTHETTCYSVVYTTNSVGARDKERSVTGDRPRVVMLGDSFVEGIGVDASQRMSALLEARTGLEHLNFARAGFGTTQELLVYESLARRFRHDLVMVGVLPLNDLQDDDLEFQQRSGPASRRPFFVGPDHRLIYTSPPPAPRRDSPIWRLRLALRDYSYAYNVYSYFRNYRDYVRAFEQQRRRRAWAENLAPVTGYYHFTEEQFDRLRYALRRLVAAAGGRPVVVFLVPSPGDLREYPERGEPLLSRRLAAVAAGDGFSLVDLLPEFARRATDIRALYLPCDPHFSPLGHRLAADVLEGVVREMVAGRRQ